MKLICERDALNRALHCVVARARNKTKIPILAHVKVEARDNRLTLTATDLDSEAVASCAAEVASPGARAVPADRLAQIVAGWAAGSQVEMEMRDNETQLRCGRSRYTLNTLDAAEFPVMPEPRNPSEFALGCVDARTLFGDPQAAILIDGSRKMLEGGYLYQSDATQLSVVATDGVRYIRRTITTGATLVGRYIVPKTAMAEIVKLATEGEIRFRCGENLIEVIGPHMSFKSKLIEATYPDTERLIAKLRSQYILIDRADILAAIKRLTAVAGQSPRIDLQWSDDGQPLEMTLSGEGSGTEQLGCESDAPKGQLTFSPSFLAEMLSVPKGDTVQLHYEYGVANKPLRIFDPSDDGLIVMVMPCREVVAQSRAAEAA